MDDCPNVDTSTGQHYGYCDSCGEEAPLNGWPCCDDGEVVPNDDESCEEWL